MSLFGITKLGEGVSNPEGHIPIDIHYNKLLEWLVDRKKIPTTWKKNYPALLERVKVAVADLPVSVEEFQPYIKGEQKLGYFDIENIMQLLESKGGESTAKNVFGQFTAKRMKEWYDIQRAYESDHIYLGEAANILISNVNYEIPLLKTSIDKATNQINDFSRKESEWNRAIQSYKTKFDQNCASLGIKGIDTKREILDLISQLPEMYEKIVELIKEEPVKEAVQLYKEFNAYIQQSNKKENVNGEEEFPMLTYVINHGNDTLTVMEKRRKGETIIEETEKSEITLEKSEDQNANKALEIDWTVIDDDTQVTDVKVSNETGSGMSTDAPMEINWDISIGTDSADTTSQPGIVWDLDDISSSSQNDENVIEVVEASNVATEQETILGSTVTRNKLVDDVLELYNFLEQRVEELESENIISLNIFQNAPKIVQANQSVDVARRTRASIKKIVDQLEGKRFRELLEIKNSRRYVDRLAASLNHFIECIEKSKSSIRYAEKKKEDCNATISEAYPKMEHLIQRTKELKVKVEQTLSKQYGGREVHIMGEINNF